MRLKEYKIELTIILIALFSTISTLIFSNLFPNKQVLALTMLTLILPAIYQIGHIFSKEVTRAKNEQDFSFLQDIVENITIENNELKKILEEYGIEFEEEEFFNIKDN